MVVFAVALPVLLIFVALILDAGNWFTHSRQLQNRAAAAVQAGGVEYARQWAKCTAGTTDQRDDASDQIVAAAKGYGGVTFNREITDVKPDDIVVNDDNDNLCDPLNPSLEVRVTEKNVKSLFASFGLPIAQTSATSRVELMKAASETGFVPLAIEDQQIVKAQARFFNACTGQELSDPDNPPTLTPVAPTAGTPAGLTLWRGEAPITLPSAAAAGFGCAAEPGEPPRDFEPVSVQLRLASRNEVDLGNSCAALIAAPFADCFNDITQFRTFACRNKPPPANDFPTSICVGEDAGAGSNGPGDIDFYTVNFSGPSCDPDPYYARLPSTASSCTFSASVYINWFDRPAGTCEVELQVDDGPPHPLTGPCPTGGAGSTENGQWNGINIPLTSPGRHNVRLTWRWHSVENGGGWTCAPPAPPCNEGESFVIHRTNLADDPVADTSPTDIVRLVKVSDDPGGVTQVHSKHADGQAHLYYLTVGLKSEIAPMQFTTLRTRFPGNRALVCDPDYAGGRNRDDGRTGLQASLRGQSLQTGFWWDGTACPASATWFSAPYSNTPVALPPHRGADEQLGWRACRRNRGPHWKLLDYAGLRSGSVQHTQSVLRVLRSQVASDRPDRQAIRAGVRGSLRELEGIPRQRCPDPRDRDLLCDRLGRGRRKSR